ncbi:MAG: hypothetical protein ACFE0I_01000 [Elainellaceae cyanobacterium]
MVKKLDRKTGGNDLLVRSWTMYGSEPPVEIVHFFKKNVGENFIGENLAVEHMFADQSYHNETLEIHLQILEVDGHSNIERDIKAVAQFLGAVFPTILPFTSIASGLYASLNDIFKNQHDLAFSASLELHSEATYQPNHGYIPLRCGAYIFFENDVDGSMYKLRDLKVEPIVINQSSTALDYMVIKIIPRFINSLNSEDLLANQRLAASLFQENVQREFVMPDAILKKVEHKVASFKLLQDIIRKAKYLEDLAEYYKLRKLQQTESDSISIKKHLDQEERLQSIAAELKRNLEGF